MEVSRECILVLQFLFSVCFFSFSPCEVCCRCGFTDWENAFYRAFYSGLAAAVVFRFSARLVSAFYGVWGVGAVFRFPARSVDTVLRLGGGPLSAGRLGVGRVRVSVPSPRTVLQPVLQRRRVSLSAEREGEGGGRAEVPSALAVLQPVLQWCEEPSHRSPKGG